MAVVSRKVHRHKLGRPEEGVVLGVVFSRLLQAVKLERDAFVWMDFNDRATGDAVILVAVTQVLLALGTGASLLDLLNPVTLIRLVLFGLFFWVLYSGATYLITRHLLDGGGSVATYFRIAGFAYPTLLVAIFANFLFDSFLLTLVVGAAWFIVVVAFGVMYIGDVTREKAFLAAVGGYAAVVTIQAILSGLRIF